MKELTEELRSHLKEEGYLEIREIPGRGVCAIRNFMYTWGLCIGIDETGYYGRYCYESPYEAFAALSVWDGKDDPQLNWIRYKGYGGERWHYCQKIPYEWKIQKTNQ